MGRIKTSMAWLDWPSSTAAKVAADSVATERLEVKGAHHASCNGGSGVL